MQHPSLPAIKRNPWFRNHLIRDSIGRAIYESIKEDPAIYLFGEGAHLKMHFDAPKIEQEFPHRVHTLPISEDANTNFAVGASLVGVKPVVDVITADFLYRTMDSIANTAAKINFVSTKDEPSKTIVIRSEFLIGCPTTGQRPEALFVHIPGLSVALPSTPKDAYGLMRTALSSPGVTIFFEDRMIKDTETKAEDYDTETMSIPFGKASIRRSSENPILTIVTYGLMRQVTEAVLDRERVENIDLIDLRTLYPIDWATLISSVQKTGRLLIIEPDVRYGGIGAEIVASIVEETPASIVRLGGPRVTIPASRDLHERMLPSEAQIANAIREMSSL